MNTALFVLVCILVIPLFVWAGRAQWRAYLRSPVSHRRPTRIAQDPNERKHEQRVDPTKPRKGRSR